MIKDNARDLIYLDTRRYMSLDSLRVFYWALDLVDRGLVTNQIVLTVNYDIENLTNTALGFNGAVTTDHYGRKIPKHSHGSENIGRYTSSARLITDCADRLFERIADRSLSVRRVNIVAARVLPESDSRALAKFEQLDLFTDYDEAERAREEEDASLEREKSKQNAILDIKKKFGKNAILKGMNLEDGATAKDRNAQIGGHKA